MKDLFKFFFLVITGVLFFSTSVSANTKPGTGASTSDTTASIKSNIVIFKMIPSPSTGISNPGGSLKKAGKVARTSSSGTHPYIKHLRPVSSEG